MNKYRSAARELMVVEQTARWNPRVRRILRTAPLVVVFFLITSQAARAQCTFSPTPDPTVDGASNSLRQVIQMANASGEDCTIQLQAGTYTLTVANTQGHVSDSSSGDLNITDSGHMVTIQGKGPALSIVNGNSIDRVFQISNGANAVFTGLTIKGGLARDDGTVGALPGTTESDGGGLLIQDGGQATLSQVWIENNSALGANAGITGSNFRGANGTAAAGGGLFISSGRVDLTNGSLINGNAATGGKGGDGPNVSASFSDRGGNGGGGGTGLGGGLYLASGTFNLEESTISDNTATGGAGGTGGSARLVSTNSRLTGAQGGGGGNGEIGFGGGLYVASGTIALNNSTISGNAATGGSGGIGGSGTAHHSTGRRGPGGNGRDGTGGGVYLSIGTAELVGSTISGNVATAGNGGRSGLSGPAEIGGGGNGGSSEGGGMFVAGGSVNVVSATVFTNTANRGGTGGSAPRGIPGANGNSAGGGLFISGGAVSLSEVTVASNNAKPGGITSIGHPGSSFGGGIANTGATAFNIKDTLVGNDTRDSNSPGEGPDISGAVTSSYSLISQATGASITDSGGNILGQNPQLDPNGLQSNGGPTQTVALEDNSPALDAVPVGFCTDQAGNAITTDQRGMPRPDVADESVCDIGAVEFQDVPFASFTSKLDVTLSTATFALNSKFTLGSASNGINPVSEEVTCQIGDYIVVVAPGSFTQNKKGAYAFQGSINGVSLSLSISPAGSKAYTFLANGTGANLASLANPVTVALTIGNDRGSTQDSARIR